MYLAPKKKSGLEEAESESFERSPNYVELDTTLSEEMSDSPVEDEEDSRYTVSFLKMVSYQIRLRKFGHFVFN